MLTVFMMMAIRTECSVLRMLEATRQPSSGQPKAEDLRPNPLTGTVARVGCSTICGCGRRRASPGRSRTARSSRPWCSGTAATTTPLALASRAPHSSSRASARHHLVRRRRRPSGCRCGEKSAFPPPWRSSTSSISRGGNGCTLHLQPCSSRKRKIRREHGEACDGTKENFSRVTRRIQ